ncbi:FKBP-type peptidyl-prolyl cis-trans isomerase SlyD [BD1-7 clade bacterium]|uniref:Peptidyl-prolyl cis-trans isomerase n=1 Tax=BD1-7 clade bacterium TaxID=2029982 RepID=A0A5S9NSH0_9GAMM|nr:FKBP-type peptidyl-prolyl cis-trans isomerase SlyD [BD1-7 clade bacterium]CAA0093377.1 FKBP-type peptidyl-prolyl cis-trans isomerase SlyD [BD1-7 clade bacterium]
MMIQKDTRVCVELTLTADSGEELAKYPAEEPASFVVGHQQILKGIEDALLGKTVGEAFELELPPELAFGEVDVTAIQTVSITAFEDVEDLTEGTQLFANTAEGQVPVTITAIDAGMVTVDANPPFAGYTVKATGKVLSVDLPIAPESASSDKSAQ